MTRDDIIYMARTVGFKVDWQHADVAEVKTRRLEDFANLVAAAEREACAQWCEAAMTDKLEDEAYYVCKNLAAVIRARGQI